MGLKFQWDQERGVLQIYDDVTKAVRYEATPPPDVVAAFEHMANGDPGAYSAIMRFESDFLGALPQRTEKVTSTTPTSEGSAAAQGDTSGGRTLLAIPEAFAAAAKQYGTYNAYREGIQKITATEQSLIQDMRAAGADPARFFPEGGTTASAGDLKQTDLAAVATALAPGYWQAYGDLDAEAAHTDLVTRTGRLQQIAQQWAAAKTGIGRLEGVRKSREGIEDMERAYRDTEAQQSKNIAADAAFQPVTMLDGSVQWAHGSAGADALRTIDRAKRDYQRQLQEMDPAGYAASQQQQAPSVTPPAPPQPAAATDAGVPAPRRRRSQYADDRALVTPYALGGREGQAEVIPAPRRGSSGGNITITINVPAGGGGREVNAVTSPPAPRSRLADGGRVARYQEGGTPELTGLGATGPGVVESEAKRQQAVQEQQQNEWKIAMARQELAQQRQNAENRFNQQMQAAQVERQQALAAAQQRAASQSVSAAVQGARNPWASVGVAKVG